MQVAVLAALSLGACQVPGPPPAGGGPGSRPPAASPPAAPGGALPRLFPAGAVTKEGKALRRRYQLDLVATLSPGTAAGSTPDGPVRGSEVHLSGTWSVTRVDVDRDETVILAELTARELEVTAPRSAIVTAEDYRQRMRADLERAMLFKQDSQGLIVAFKADPRLMAPALAILRAVGAAVQTSAGAAGEGGWLADEDDTGGRFRARYERAGDRLFRTKKLEYLQVDSGEGLRAPRPGELRVVASSGEMAGSPAGALASVKLDEELASEPGPGLPPLAAKSSYRLTLVGDEMVTRPAEAVARFDGLDWRPLYRQPPAEAHQLEIDLTKVAQYTSVAQVIADLDRLRPHKNAGDGERQKRLQIALGALFRLKANAMVEAQRLLDRGDRHADVILWALTSAGTPRAQQLAVDFLLAEPSARGSVTSGAAAARAPGGGRRPAAARRGALGTATRAELLVNLCLVRHPTAALAEGLLGLLRDPLLRGQALLGLGSIAFRLQQDDPALARRVLHALASELEAATSAGSFGGAEIALRAFGNAGAPEMVGILQPYLTSPQAPVRAAAVAALRRVPTPEIDRLLSAYLASDTSDKVRAAARRTLDERKNRRASTTDAG